MTDRTWHLKMARQPLHFALRMVQCAQCRARDEEDAEYLRSLAHSIGNSLVVVMQEVKAADEEMEQAA